jgi:hypothetical protein
VLGVTKHFDVIKYILSGLVARCVNFATNRIAFKKLEKAFSNAVVVTVTAPGHARLQIVRFQECLPVIAAELTTLIGIPRLMRLASMTI